MNTKQGKLRRVLRVIGWVLLGIVTCGLAIVVVRKIWAPRILGWLGDAFLDNFWMAMMAIVIIIGAGVMYLVEGPSQDRELMKPHELPNTHWRCAEEALGMEIFINNDGSMELTQAAEDGQYIYRLTYMEADQYFQIFAPSDETGAEDGELLMEGDIFFFEDVIWITIYKATNRLIDSSYTELDFYRVTE